MIDPAIVDTTDEVGRATVGITIPAGTRAGVLPLTITVPETGTSIVVPLVTSAEPIVSVTAPTISGKSERGKKLTASDGTWSVSSPTLAFQWLR